MTNTFKQIKEIIQKEIKSYLDAMQAAPASEEELMPTDQADRRYLQFTRVASSNGNEIDGQYIPVIMANNVQDLRAMRTLLGDMAKAGVLGHVSGIFWDDLRLIDRD
jgi:hypothetical protein